MMSKNVTRKPYCKVCHDAGKTELEYTSHWVKDLTGKTTCPTLLNQECRYCDKSGHTVKFCDILAQNNSSVERKTQSAAAKKPAANRQTVNMKSVNKLAAKKEMVSGFAALCYDSDSDEEVSENMNSSIGKEVKNEVEVSLTGWAAIAAKPKAVKEEIKNTGLLFLTRSKPIQKPIQEPIQQPIQEPKLAPWAKKEPVQTKSWADWSDSEDEEEFNDAWD